MSFVDWVYIIGGFVLLIVLLDGLRRMNINWKQRVRLRVESEEGIDQPSQHDGVELLRGELPNGGARVVRTEPYISGSEAQHSHQSEFTGNDSSTDNDGYIEESVYRSEPEESIEFSAEAIQTDTALDQQPQDNRYEEDGYEEDGYEENGYEQEVVEVNSNEASNKISEEAIVGRNEPGRSVKEFSKIKGKAGAKIKAAVQKQLDFSDALFATADTPPPEQTSSAPKPEEIEEIIVIHIEIPSSELVTNELLVPLLLDNGMHFGEMGIFHRQDDRNIASTPLFSLANSREPGSFDMESGDGFDVSGLTLFFTLPGPEDPVVALDEMVRLAEILKTELRADWLDSGRNPLNTQILEHLSQKVRDYKLQHPA